MRKIAVVVSIVGMLWSCSGAKETIKKQELPVFKQLLFEPSIYEFKQHPARAACKFHNKEETELVQFVEMDYAGDRDDKVPRRIKDLPSALSKTKTDNAQRVQVKICFTTEGEVVAFRHESVADKEMLHTALFQVSYEMNAEDACVVCKTESFYIVE